jgi:DNA-binding transcriptional regulator PaaX
LVARGFGCLQGSVWVTPDSVEDERAIVAGGEINVKSLILFEARPCAGEKDAEIVAAAWDFGAINQCYVRHLEILDRRPEGPIQDAQAARRIQKWLKDEREAWRGAVDIDPFLPKCLLPSDYLGCCAWKKRFEILPQIACAMRAYGRTASDELLIHLDQKLVTRS